MARKKRSTGKQQRNKGSSPLEEVEVGQRVVVNEYGAGTVVAVKCRRGIHFRDAWIRPDDRSVREIGVCYQHGIYPEHISS